MLDLVNRRNLAFMYKERLDVEMFKIIKGSYSHRLSPISSFDLVNSSKRSDWYSRSRIQDDEARFKVALKNCNLTQIGFMKGACVNFK